MDREKKAEFLLGFHHTKPILVLPNAWDVGSGVLLAGLPGCRALATTSAGIARSLGYEDGEQTPVAEMIEMARRIAAAVDVPVTADLERGYGDWVATAHAAWDAGVVGMNFEDSTGGALVPVEDQVAAIREIKAAVPKLVLNARVDVFLMGSGDADEAVERANAYLAAGADCTYPYCESFEPVPDLVERIKGPVNVVYEPTFPSPSELEAIGVARVTWGVRLARYAYAEAVRIAADGLA
ncbi:MAG TPA: isocitrate lyase/phosphoenolpyruvate mutase family protein [Gaiellaceae bacterium]|jgi:2-methylisocitrate lyase-like PEP mutase family enzyme